MADLLQRTSPRFAAWQNPDVFISVYVARPGLLIDCEDHMVSNYDEVHFISISSRSNNLFVTDHRPACWEFLELGRGLTFRRGNELPKLNQLCHRFILLKGSNLVTISLSTPFSWPLRHGQPPQMLAGD